MTRMTQEAVYEKLFKNQYIIESCSHSSELAKRKANRFAVQFTAEAWRKQFAKEEIVETIFRGDQIIYVVAEAEGINDFNSVSFYYDGVQIDMKDLGLIFQTVDQED